MTDITAHLVKELREKTGAGFMDCKKSLLATDGNVEKAIEHLRKSGIAKASKKAGRATKEGKIVTFIDDGAVSMVEVLCETDFVAKNKVFTGYCQNLAQSVARGYVDEGNLALLVAEKEKDGIAALIAKIGENIVIRRACRWIPQGKCFSYVHMGGKIGVLLDINELEEEVSHQLGMHIAAFNPSYISPEQIPQEIIEKEKEIAVAHPSISGKPKNIMDKILQGKISKWYTEVCLLKQGWIKDDQRRVEQILSPKTHIFRFVRWQIGEEIESNGSNSVLV